MVLQYILIKKFEVFYRNSLFKYPKKKHSAINQILSDKSEDEHRICPQEQKMNDDMSVFYIQRWALDSLFVNRETGNRAVGSASGCSQDFPARAKKTWHMSSQGNDKCWHVCKERCDFCQKTEAASYQHLKSVTCFMVCFAEIGMSSPKNYMYSR